MWIKSRSTNFSISATKDNKRHKNCLYLRYSSMVTFVETTFLWKLLAWHVYKACWWTLDKFLTTSLLFSADGNEKSSIVLDNNFPLLDHVTVGGGVPKKEKANTENYLKKAKLLFIDKINVRIHRSAMLYERGC